ncbi:MAG: ionic transporter y4hA [Planctomycetes bacterium]|nr:ionic transporter y4hA [Planctomycetota bacterium]
MSPAPRWTWIVPAAALLALGLGMALPPGWPTALLCLPALIAAVLAAVHHAEVVAHRVGEPFGTLVLALAITVIEVALILSVMVGGDPAQAGLARDTIYATVMIICNGVVGLCLLVGALRHHQQAFRVDGTHAAFAALIALSGLTLVLPSFTTSSAGPTYSPAQLAFAAGASLTLWAVFVFGQTVRHRDYFLPVGAEGEADAHAERPSVRRAWASLGLLVATLVAVVGLAKVLSPLIERAVAAAGAPRAVIGIAIAMLVLLPETWAAIRAALANRLQTSLNLAYGSALASIGLTIPAVAGAALVLGLPLELGLDAKAQVTLLISVLVGTMTMASGRTNLIQGAVHLVLFAAFLFLSLVP